MTDNISTNSPLDPGALTADYIGDRTIPYERVSPNALRSTDVLAFVPTGSVLIPLTEEHFTQRYDAFLTFHFYEDDNGDYVHAYGTKDSKGFAEAVGMYDYYATRGKEGGLNYDASKVEHVWGIGYARPDDIEDWRYVLVPEGTERAVPITRLPR